MKIIDKSHPCRLCGGTEVQDWLYPREMMLGLREQFAYFRCASCGCLQIDQIPDNLEKYYPGDYYSFRKPEVEKESLRKSIRRAWINRLITKHIIGGKCFLGHVLYHLFDQPPIPFWWGQLVRPVSLESPVLDVGCGSGANLLDLRECGFSNLRGVDRFIPRSQTYPGNVRVDKGRLEDVQGEFSLIMLHHVFEHLEDPLTTLRKARQLLASGGQILIRIPLSDSYAARKYQENWVQLDAPRHLMLFTRKSMEYIAKKADLTITRVVYDSFEMQFWGSEQYLQDIPLYAPCSHLTDPLKSVLSKKQIKEFAEEANRLNKEESGDQAAFILEAV